MPPLKAAFAKLLQLTRAAQSNPAVRTLIALGLFWICFVHIVPSLSSGLLVDKRILADGWPQQMAAVQTGGGSRC